MAIPSENQLISIFPHGDRKGKTNPLSAPMLLRGYNSIKINVKRRRVYNHPVFTGSGALSAVVLPGPDGTRHV